MTEPRFYAIPTGATARLPQQPRLASWNASTSPDQVRLASYLVETITSLTDAISEHEPPLALRLDVGLPVSVDVLAAHDLDNYLYPLAAKLAPFRDPRFVSFWATKQQGSESFVRVETAVLSGAVAAVEVERTVETTAAGDTAAYKRQVRDQLGDSTQLASADGPVRLELSFLVGPSRNWINLWKPTIDALDPILGRTYAERDWHPRDGRIVELGLHCTVEASVGHRVRLAIRASTLAPSET